MPSGSQAVSCAAGRRALKHFVSPLHPGLCDLFDMADKRWLLIKATTALVASLLAGSAAAEEPGQPIASAVELHNADCLELRALVAGITRYLHRDTVDARIHIIVREGAKGVSFTLSDGARTWDNTYPIARASCAERRSGIPLGIA